MVDCKKYTVWQKSHDLVLSIYKLTAGFPKSEQFNFVFQINSAALSIPTNNAEGCGRETQKELIRFLYISSGSAFELEYLILASKDLGFTNEPESKELLEAIKKMLFSLIRKIKSTL